MNDTALFFVTHGSSDRRSWLVLQDLLTVARSRSDRSESCIGGGCLEGQDLSLAAQLEQFVLQAIPLGIRKVIVIPLFLLAGVHVSDDLPHEIAIAEQKLQTVVLDRSNAHIAIKITPHLGTNSQIPDLLEQHFERFCQLKTEGQLRQISLVEPQARILIAHGSRIQGANQVVEDLASQCKAIAAYWGVEPKLETQIENLLSQGITNIYVLPYFLTEGGITEAIAKRLQPYSDRAQIQLLPVPLSYEHIVDLAMDLALTFLSFTP